MFDIGWTEIMVIACVAIIVVGPKDLPRMLRTLGQTMGKMRKMSREFQSTFNDALKEVEQQADIADMKKTVDEAANFNPLGDLKKSIEEEAFKKVDVPKTETSKAEKAEPAVASIKPVPEPVPEPKVEAKAAPAIEDVKA
ncbi:MAG: Sec-independent protein translocase protein TatB [Roseibium sp.]